MTHICHSFPSKHNGLMLGGRHIREIAEAVGSTPFYVYDRQTILDAVTRLREAMPASMKLHYAVKANPMPGIVELLAENIDGFDVASKAEMRLALDSHAPPDAISFTGPGKSDEEITAALNAGVIINIESIGEVNRVAHLADTSSTRPRITLRVNPEFELKASGMRMGGGSRPFGIDAEKIPDVLKAVDELKLEFLGFHIFCGSQSLNADAIIQAQQETFRLACALAEHAPAPVRILNLGGGFGIPYFANEMPLDLSAIGENLNSIAREATELLPEASLVIELGRYLVGEAGVYVSKILDRKQSRGQTFLVTDGGMHHHLAASGNLGQIIRKNYPVQIVDRLESETTETVSVVGRLCTPLDILADKVCLPKAKVGDLVGVFQSGAYGLSASPVGFLSHTPAREILV